MRRSRRRPPIGLVPLACRSGHKRQEDSRLQRFPSERHERCPASSTGLLRRRGARLGFPGVRSTGSTLGGFLLAAIAGCGGTVEGGPTAVSAAAGGGLGTGGHQGGLPDSGSANGGRSPLPDGG